MPESAISILGLAATALLLYFILINLRHGSKATKPEIRVGESSTALPVVISVFFALLQAWYLVLIQFLIAYLLIFTSLGRDIMTLLLNNPAWYVAWFSGIMLLIFALTMWLIPWHVLDVGTYRELRRKRAYLVVLRFLGFFTFVVFLLSIYAIDQDWEDFPHGLFWTVLMLAFVVYWILEISIGESNIAQSLYLLLCLTGVLLVEVFASNQHYEWFKWIIVFWALFFWTITGPAPGFHKKKENEKNLLDATPKMKTGIIFFFLHWIKKFQSAQTWLGLRIGKITTGLDRRTNPHSNIKDEAKDLSKNPKERLNAYRFYGNRFTYRILFVVILMLALLSLYLPNLEPVSPIVFVYTGMGFLLILADYMYYTGRRVVAFAANPAATADQNPNYFQKLFLNLNWPNSAKAFSFIRLNLYAYVFWVIAVVMLFFASNSDTAQYNLLEKKARPERLSFQQYLDQWIEARRDSLTNSATESYPIFIFSGEGGGSRAGYWTSSCLLGLDSLLELDLKQHTLAISAVSGSSPGTVATLAWWEHGNQSGYQAYCTEIYQHNFISAGLAGNVFGATLSKFLKYFYFKNRNIRLCEEEAAAIDGALKQRRKGAKSVFSTLYSKDQFAWGSFSGLYQSQNHSSWRTDLPLFFSNSTHVQTGRRVLINPVINLSAEQRFINVIDLCKRIEDSTKQELALVHAANLSELFPFMSASAHIPKLGNYADASYCENYGLKTAYEIYQACQDWKNNRAQDSLAAKCQFYVVALMNTHPTYSANSPNLPMEESIPSETLAPLIAIGNVVLSNNPFSTREEIKSVLPKKVYHEMILNRSNLPLTRVLTRKNMQMMDSIRMRELQKFQLWFGTAHTQ